MAGVLLKVDDVTALFASRGQSCDAEGVGGDGPFQSYQTGSTRLTRNWIALRVIGRSANPWRPLPRGLIAGLNSAPLGRHLCRPFRAILPAARRPLGATAPADICRLSQRCPRFYGRRSSCSRQLSGVPVHRPGSRYRPGRRGGLGRGPRRRSNPSAQSSNRRQSSGDSPTVLPSRGTGGTATKSPWAGLVPA